MKEGLGAGLTRKVSLGTQPQNHRKFLTLEFCFLKQFQINLDLILFNFSLSLSPFFMAAPGHMEVPRPGTESELQLRPILRQAGDGIHASAVT